MAYIVKNTVGAAVAGKSPQQLKGFRVLDPACGSGSFLLGAYQCLLDYYLGWYAANAPDEHPKTVWRQGEAWRLTTAEKKRILLEHIFGVDIDRQAVEVTKLSLLLKVLETESDESLGRQLALFHEEAKERALPNLDRNIKCGNSLIGPDYFGGQLIPEDDELKRVNPFDWAKEFPQAMKPAARALWFATFVTHNSRVSERMLTYGVQTGEPLIFSPEDQVLIAEKIFETCRQEGIAVVAANVLPDHVHLVVAAEDEKTLEEHIRKIKGASSFAFQRARGWEKGSHQHVWAQKFHRAPIADPTALTNILEYVHNNHLKHVERWGETLVTTWDKGLKPLVRAGCVSVEEACQPRGGFDCVIGNPPYVRPHNIPEETKEILWAIYTTFVAKSDMYSCFMERGLSLTRPSGLFGFIVPHTWTSLESFTKIREFLIRNSRAQRLVRLPKKVFANATVETCIFVVQRERQDVDNGAQSIVVERLEPNGRVYFEREFLQKTIEDAYLYNFQLYGRDESKVIVEKIQSRGRPIAELVSFVYGFKTADDEKFIHATKKHRESKPFIRSAAIRRYTHDSPDEYVWYVPEQMIRNRKTARPGEAARFEAEKIVVARMGKALVATYDVGGLYVKDAMLLLSNRGEYSLQYLLGIINSRLMNYFYREFFVTIDVLKNALLSLPVALPNFSDPADKARHDKMVMLVEQMLDLHKRLAAAQDTGERERLQRLIDSTDQQIDALVYELYGLTPEEIAIVERRSA